MPDDPAPTVPVDPADLRRAISHALQYNGKRRWTGADQLLAGIAAEHIAEHLALSGFIVSRRAADTVGGGQSRLTRPPPWLALISTTVATTISITVVGV